MCVPSSELGPPPPLPQASEPHPEPEAGTYSPAGKVVGGGGGPSLDDWRKTLALCLLCGPGKISFIKFTIHQILHDACTD